MKSTHKVPDEIFGNEDSHVSNKYKHFLNLFVIFFFINPPSRFFLLGILPFILHGKQDTVLAILKTVHSRINID